MKMIVETDKKLTMWEDQDSDTWSTTQFDVTDEALGALRVELDVSDNDFPDWFPSQVAGLRRWEVLLTVDGEHHSGVVSTTKKNVVRGEIYLTVSVSGW